MSRSRNVSRRRRTLPASDTCSAAGCVPQRLDRRQHGGQPVAEQRPRRRLRLRTPFKRLQHVLLDLRAEPAQRPQPLLLGRLAQAVERRHVELEPDPPRGLRAEPRQAHERDHVGRDPRLAAWSAPRSRRSRRSGRSSPRSSSRCPAAPSPSRRARAARSSRRSPDPLRRAAVGKHPKGLRPFELEHVGEQLELLDHFRIPRRAPLPRS